MSAKTGVLTGAAGGIGRATAERLVKEGWSLVLVDQHDGIAKVAGEIAIRGGPTIVRVATDITKPDQYAAIDKAVAAIGAPLKFLGLIAGALQKVGSIETLDKRVTRKRI